MAYNIVLFGEAEKGEFRYGYFCKNLIELSEHLGEPPSKDAKGLAFAIQALLFNRGVIFFRVHEEGFSIQDYYNGLQVLEKTQEMPPLTAICLPGVGNNEIIEATTPLCEVHQSFLILTEKDLYDFLMN
jgi:hypothetical protein